MEKTLPTVRVWLISIDLEEVRLAVFPGMQNKSAPTHTEMNRGKQRLSNDFISGLWKEVQFHI